MKKNIHIVILIAAVIAMALFLILTFAHKAGNGNAVVKQTEAQEQETSVNREQEAYYGCGIEEEGHCPHCDQGIKDAACICGGHSFMEKGEALKNCPICKKPLKKIISKDLPKEVKTAKAAPKVLYYRNPMSPEITSPTPMKDTMGMDYIPVYEEGQVSVGEAAQEGQAVSRVHLTKDQAVLSGVVSEAVSKLKLSKEIRTVGRIAFDPGLTVAQEEFLTALETRQKVSMSPDPDVILRAQDLVDKSKIRLRLLGMGDEEIAQLEKDKTAQIGLVLPEDKAWVYADVYEYDLGWVKQGQAAEVAVTAYPGEVFGGVIKSISPVLEPKTRTARVRLEIDNPQRKLKPEMYVDVVIKAVYKDQSGNEDVLAVPRDAVLDTGLRKIVYVDIGDGTFLGKEIKTGPEASASINGQKFTFYPVLSGLEGNEKVVTKGNFLIDSQSQLTGGMSVLWGGAQEIKTEEQTASQGAAPVATQHQH
ncbi:MAG: efflux RND transporter periplasmic adaptor subunit [Candidatus Omnitrophica bacterium]|nr:efflux RND transporter periplasmic adaptor subunit [Candidatus Omnitrophota bacterium]